MLDPAPPRTQRPFAKGLSCPSDQLDRVKVTLIHQQGKGRLMTDDGTEVAPCVDTKSAWTGVADQQRPSQRDGYVWWLP